MNKWKISCPVNNIDELKIALRYFKYIDISIYYFRLSVGLEQGESPDLLIDILMPYKKNIASIHMLNKFTFMNNKNESSFEQDIRLMSALDIKIGILHLKYPVNLNDVNSQLEFIHPFINKTKLNVAIENLPDSSNKSQGFNWIKNPNKISEHLGTIQSSNLGLCLDTSHAICCKKYHWNCRSIQDQLLAIHLSNSLPDQDKHLPIDSTTNCSMLKEIELLARNSANNGVIVLEQLSLEQSIKSLHFLKKTKMFKDKCFDQ